MEFGKVIRVEEVNFSLPPDDRMTNDLLQTITSGKGVPKESGKEDPAKLYVGCTQWGNKNWIGKVYPKGTKDKDFLALYAQQFNSIELNTLFYNMQPKSVIERWASLTDKDFRFCPKFLNTISHTLQLKNARRDTELFIDHMQSFGTNLGYSFLQLSDKFGPDRADTLQDYIRMLPGDFRTCVELRHKDWFTASNDTWQLFRDLGIGTVITDTAGRRDCLHMKLTAPVAFIRFVGNNLHPSDFFRIDAWADRIKTWIDRGLREIYFILHSPDELYAPQLARYAVEQFNLKCGTNLKPPRLLQDNQPKNGTLF